MDTHPSKAHTAPTLRKAGSPIHPTAARAHWTRNEPRLGEAGALLNAAAIADAEEIVPEGILAE